MYSSGVNSRFNPNRNEIKKNYRRQFNKNNKYTQRNDTKNDPILINKNSYLNSRVRLNISGKIFEVPEAILSRYPLTLLGCYEERIKFYDYVRDEFFFDRNREAFEGKYQSIREF